MMSKKSSYKDELISEIKSLVLSQGLNTVFTTFLEITATSIAAQMDPQNAEEREQRYQAIASKMAPETLSSYARMFALLALATREHAEDPCDILGDVYHQLRLNNEWNGQFFTPDHICRLMAQLLTLIFLQIKKVRLPSMSRRAVQEQWLSVQRGLCREKVSTIVTRVSLWRRISISAVCGWLTSN